MGTSHIPFCANDDLGGSFIIGHHILIQPSGHHHRNHLECHALYPIDKTGQQNKAYLLGQPFSKIH